MSWHNFEPEQMYSRDEVVTKCKAYVNSKRVKSVKEKRLLVRLIDSSGHQSIRYKPQSKKGWGSSPLNPNNWQTRDGNPIVSK
jgi:hypothetical protein